MADEEKKDELDGQIEDEVSALLAEAESLTTELSAEIGEEPAAAEAVQRDQEFFESESDSEASLDLQVAQAESALDQASAELGAEPQAPAKPKKKISLPRKGQAATSASTDADTGQSAAPSETATKSKGKAKKLSLPPKGKSPKQAAEGEGSLSPELVAGVIEETPYEFEPPRESRWSRLKSSPVVQRLAKFRDPCARGMGRMLELIDRPFGRVSMRTRHLLGWASIVLAAGAIFLFVFVVW